MLHTQKKVSSDTEVQITEEIEDFDGVWWTENQEKRITRKIDLHILPFAIPLYLFCSIDRSNIGNVRVLNSNTNDDLLSTNGFTVRQFTVMLTLFLIPYCLLEVPSNFALKRFMPNRWLGLLGVTFGAFCVGLSGTHNVAGVVALRMLIGAAEAGVFPGIVFFLSFWYKPQERATRLAAFLCVSALAGAFGGAIAYGVGHMNGFAGLQGWRWVFILEGLPPIVLGALVFFFMPNYPENARWLTAQERRIQTRRLGPNASQSSQKLNWTEAKATLKEIRLWIHYLIILCVGIQASSLSLFSPIIVTGLGYKDLQAQLFTVPPFAIAFFVLIAVALLSDHKKLRGPIAAISFATGAVAFLVLACLPGTHYGIRYACLVIATSAYHACLPTIFAWIPDNVRSTTAISLAVGLNNSFAQPGQVIGIWIYRQQEQPFYRLGHAVNAGSMATACILCLGLSMHYTRLNRKLAKTDTLRWVA